MTFVAKEKRRGIGQRCNFLQRRALAFTDVLLARATPYSTLILESLWKVSRIPDQGGEREEASTAKWYVRKVDHFSSEHLYVETRYHTACSMSSKGIC